MKRSIISSIFLLTSLLGEATLQASTVCDSAMTLLTVEELSQLRATIERAESEILKKALSREFEVRKLQFERAFPGVDLDVEIGKRMTQTNKLDAANQGKVLQTLATEKLGMADYLGWERTAQFEPLRYTMPAVLPADRVANIEVSPDGKYAAISEVRYDGFGRSYQLGLWDSGGKRLLKIFSQLAGENSVRISHDGTRLALKTWSSVQIWDIPSLQMISEISYKELRMKDRMKAMEFSKDGIHLYGANSSGTLYILDMATGKLVERQQRHKKEIQIIGESSDGQWLITGGEDRTAILTRISGKNKPEIFKVPIRDFPGWEGVTVASVSPDGKFLAFGGFEGIHVQPIAHNSVVRDYNDGLTLQKQYGHPMVSFLPNKPHSILVRGLSGTYLQIWDVAAKKEISLFRVPNESPIQKAGVLGGGKLVWGACNDGKVYIWDVLSGALVQTLDGGNDPISKAKAMDDGRTLIFSSITNHVSIWHH